MFSVIVSKSSYHVFVELFKLSDSLRLIRRCGKVLDTKESTYCCDEFGYKLQSVIRKKDGRDANRYNSITKDDVCDIRRCCFKWRNSSNEFRVTICDYYDVLVFTSGFREWSKDVHANNVETSLQRTQLVRTFVPITKSAAGAAPSLVNCIADVVCHMGPEVFAS